MSKVKNENHIVMHGWMVNELKLKGNELIIYSIIYGFSQAENQKFTGSLQYLADWTNSTKQGVQKNLKSLLEKGFINKTDKIINGVKFCEYHATKFNRVYNKVAQGIQQSCIGGIQQSCNNNIGLDIIDDNIDNKINNNQQVDKECPSREEEILEKEFERLWKLYPRKEGKSKAFKSYCKFRKSTKDDYVTSEEVEDGIEAYIRHIKANNIDPKYIKQGATWFGNRCWEDEYPEVEKADVPEWFYKEIDEEPATTEEVDEITRLINRHCPDLHNDECFM